MTQTFPVHNIEKHFFKTRRSIRVLKIIRIVVPKHVESVTVIERK